MIHGATPNARKGLLPLPDVVWTGAEAMEDGQFRISDADGNLDCELLCEPEFLLRCFVHDLPRIDHDHWESFQYRMFLYPVLPAPDAAPASTPPASECKEPECGEDQTFTGYCVRHTAEIMDKLKAATSSPVATTDST